MTAQFQSLKMLCPNGHIGTAPMRLESFELGVKEQPDLILADSGSCDIGPAPLALDESSSSQKWQRFDLEHMLVASRELEIPMIIGSAGDTGANGRVDAYVQMIKEIAEEKGLSKFKVGYFYSEISGTEVIRRLRAGAATGGLGGRGALTEADVEASDHIVAVAGVHPFIKLLDDGADVIIAGRCSDAAIFAAPAIHAGFPEALSYHIGKLLECASFCAEPYGAKESVMGTITDTDIKVTAMSPIQRCTVASVASHSMYERANPFYEYVLGGRLNMTECAYEQFDERTTRVTGAVFEPANPLSVKLEGAGRIGERSIGFAAIRDPYTIAHLDEVIAWSKSEVARLFGTEGFSVYYHPYGMNAVMEEWDPAPRLPNEVGMLVEAVAPTAADAQEICLTATKQMFYAHLPDVKGTAGSVAYLFDEVLPAKPACRWTMNHTLTVSDPLELFDLHMTEAGL